MVTVIGLHGRCCRSCGLVAGSVWFHGSRSPLLAGLVLVRLVPHSVELHWFAVAVRGLVQNSQILIPKIRNCSRCSLSILRDCPEWVLVKCQRRACHLYTIVAENAHSLYLHVWGGLVFFGEKGKCWVS